MAGYRQWIHCDAERARAESPFGATVAHGYLTRSLLSYLLPQAVLVRSDSTQTVNQRLN